MHLQFCGKQYLNQCDWSQLRAGIVTPGTLLRPFPCWVDNYDILLG
jgi:hypothetical protein